MSSTLTATIIRYMRYGNTEALEKLIYSDDDSQTHESQTKERNSKPRDPKRETINVFEVCRDVYKSSVQDNDYFPTRQHYIDTYPKYLQHRIALIKLSPPGAYIDGIGGRTEHNVFVLNTTKPEQS